jgi:hypothetical protein
MITNATNCFAGKNNARRLNIYIPENSTTNTVFAYNNSRSIAGLLGVTWTITDAYYYNTAYNIYVYPVSNVAAARSANGD